MLKIVLKIVQKYGVSEDIGLAYNFTFSLRSFVLMEIVEMVDLF